MKWVADSTGRFKFRPHYDKEELDMECERIVSAFLEARYGDRCYPLSTDDLTVMIERDTSDLDLYADLSANGDDVQGLTDFFPNRKPAVRISSRLSTDSRNEHRLRVTLAHEYAHVKFHSFLWEMNKPEKTAPLPKYLRLYQRSGFFSSETIGRFQIDRILDASETDWMEWQAGYAAGSFLMPLSPLRKLALRSLVGREWLPEFSPEADRLIEQVAGTFDVAIDAARIRLKRLGIIQA